MGNAPLKELYSTAGCIVCLFISLEVFLTLMEFDSSYSRDFHFGGETGEDKNIIVTFILARSSCSNLLLRPLKKFVHGGRERQFLL